MRATWNQLRIFAAVARHRSFTKAAAELHVVQPTVSAQVKQLAGEIGLPLFEHVGRSIHLTPVGVELERTCRELADGWSRFEMKVADLKGLKQGTLRIAIVSTAKYFVPRLLGTFCARHPGVDIALEVANRDQVLARLAENRDDLYIMGVPPTRFAIERHPFLENPLVVIAPRSHPLVGRRNVPLARLADDRFIMREPGSGTRIATEEFFLSRGFRPRVKMELGNNEAIKWSVASGLGIAVLSQHALMMEPMQRQLAVLDVEGFPIMHAWYVVYPVGKQLSVVSLAFLEELKGEARRLHEEMARTKHPGARRRASIKPARG
jgi:DNA-binding transcriptional LysR family regulator